LGAYRILRESMEDEADVTRILGESWISCCPVCRKDLLPAQELMATYTGCVNSQDDLMGLLYQDHYVDGKLHGVSTSWYRGRRRAKHSEQTFVEGRPEGPKTLWYKSGEVRSEVSYLHGKKEGICRVWYKSGQPMAEFPYHQGHIQGVCRRWLENGELENEV
jgi:antitoxin component YwqK of YwqJK toxin-antitoxin module